MANAPKDEAKAKPAARGGKTIRGRAKAESVDSGRNYTVSGTVTYEDSTPASGLTVIAHDQDDSGKDTLGEAAVTTELGTFSIPYSEADFRKTKNELGGADVIVCVYNDTHELLFKSKKKNNAAEKYKLKITLPLQLSVVRGEVLDANRKPLANMSVRAYERDLRNPQFLGSDETRSSGAYRIAYRPADSQLGDAPSRRDPWLIVEVCATPDGVALASQEVQRAARDQTVSFTLANVGAVSEWQRVGDAIRPILKGQGAPRIEVASHAHNSVASVDLAPWELTPTDVDFIANDTELNRAALEAWAASSRMLRDAMIGVTDEQASVQATLDEHGWPFFYGLARQGLAHDLEAVLRQSAAKWRQSWLAALAANQVPPLDEEQVELVEDVLELLQRLQQLDPARSGNSDLARVLANSPSPLPRAVALDALTIYQEKGLGDVDAFLELEKRHPEAGGPIRTFVRGLRVHQLVGGRDGLSQVLNARLEGSSDSIEPLAVLPSTEWLAIATQASVTPGFALRVQAQVEKQHPLTALHARLDGGRFEVPGVSNQEIREFVENDPSIADSILRGKTSTRSRTGNGAPEIQKVLGNIGLFARAGLNFEMTAELMRAGIKSPGAALRYGREYIRDQYRRTLPKEAGDEAVDSFFDLVEPVVDGGNGFMIDVAASLAYPASMYEEYKIPLPENVRENLPTLPGLFGDLDECICRPCESMLGQPAYLVDLLNLLSKESGAFELLESRRPDIPKMRLTCEKAQTSIQHIDIVLQILEEAAGTHPYLKTASAVHPWQLPFSLPHANSRAFLSRLGVSRFDLVSRRANPEATVLAAETLDLSFARTTVTQGAISEWQLLTEKRVGSALWAAYGFDIAEDISLIDPASRVRLDNQTVQEVLRRASVLVDRTGLSLDELKAVLKTEFVAGADGEARYGLTNTGQCKTSQMRVPASDLELEEGLDRLHRFARLTAKLPGWSVAQLNKAIAVCGGMETRQSAPDTVARERFLVNLAVLKRLHDEHLIPLDYLLDGSVSETHLREPLGLSALQFALLSTVTRFDLATRTVIDSNQQYQILNWVGLEAFCKAAKRIRESGLSVEQVAEALLTREQWIAVAGELSPSIKTTLQIEALLTEVQQRLRAVVVTRSDITLEAQAADALSAIFGAAAADELVRAIRDAGRPINPVEPVSAIFEKLHGGNGENHDLGEWSPLVSPDVAGEILKVNRSGNLSVDERFARLLSGIAGRRREGELIAVIAERCALAETDVRELLSSRLLLTPDGSAPTSAATVFLDKRFWEGAAPPALTVGAGPWVSGAVPRLYAWMDRLYRFVNLSAAMRLDGEQMHLADGVVVDSRDGINWRDMLASAPSTSGSAWLNPNWQALLDLVWLQQPEQVSRPALSQLVDRLKARGANAARPEDVRPLASRVEISEAVTLGICAQVVSIANSRNLREPTQLRRVFELLLLARHLDAGATQLDQLANVEDDTEAASTAKALLQAKVGEERWPAVLRRIADPLRQQRRDALVSYLIRQYNGDELRTVNDLYERFLIDPQVEPCFDTTPLLEAITATQLLAQRILFGLEEGVSASGDLKHRWTWMRNYRVWEANRKVFLFPENWLFPELRDDKSSSFKQLESALGQGELTQDLATQSFGHFLDDVAQTGQLQVLGMYEDTAEGEAGGKSKRNLYVIGRTANPPYTYSWRRCIDFGGVFMEWSPWQRIELDIQGDHVLIFVMRADLYIAWPRFKRPEPASDRANIWSISFEWSRLQGDKWVKVETSHEAKDIVAKPFQDATDGFAFRCRVSGARAVIAAYVRASDVSLRISRPDLIAPVEQPIAKEDFYSRSIQLAAWHWARNILPATGNAPASSDAHGPYQAAVVGSVLILSWECWVKAKDGTQLGYVRLGDSQSNLYSARLQPYVDNAPIGSVDLSKSCGIWVSDVIAGGIPAITSRTEFSFRRGARLVGGQFTTASVAPTPAGIQKDACLVSVLEFPESDIPTLTELGIQSSKTFIPVASFVLDNTGPAFWQSPSAGAQDLARLDHCDILLNGHQEDGQRMPLQLTAENSSLTLKPFVPPYDSDNPYWVVGAASVRDGQQDAPNIWHYREGSGACFIDAQPFGVTRYTSFTAYAATYSEAAEYRPAWDGGESLFTDHQDGRFGAVQLPALAPTGDLTFWREQADGDLAFDARLPYACYNWEVFFHAPLLIADQLSKQHKFEEAERWLRCVFDPTSGIAGTDAQRFLKFRGFFSKKPFDTQVIDDLTALAQAAAGFATDADVVTAVTKLIDRWRDAPFRPFLIARRRHIAFLWRTLFAYLDNLLAWGDSLYRRDTIESINEATMLYVLAERILGRRPRLDQNNSDRPAFSYADRIGEWDDFANYWIDVGTQGTSTLQTGKRLKDSIKQANPDGMLYFCMPFNEKIASYWNIVESRLFNVRHCRNIEGIERTLQLMDAPIDPELLVRATAAGLDLSDAISGLYAPPPHYRYSILSARAVELASEAKALGAAMLSAIEKRDAEYLARLRSSNEISLLKMVQEVRTLHIAEADRNIDALRASRRTVSTRYGQYQRLLGRKDIKAPEESESAGEESMLGRADNDVSGLGLIDAETHQTEHLKIAHGWTIAGGVVKGVAGTVHAGASIAYAFGEPGNAAGRTATAVATGISTVGDMFELVSRGWQYGANTQGITGGHQRRRDEWAYQSNQALKELQQIDKQILANQIRIDITKKELTNHLEQIEQSKAIDEVMRSKFSNEQLYQWMVSQLSGLYFNAYRMALEMAGRAERAASRELGVKPLNILRNDYWDSLRAGLLAGERLHQDLKRLEVSYLDQNRREYELTKHVSLRRLNPEALMNFRIRDSDGRCRCEFEIPEWLFDLDTPGLYLRRIKSVSVSIPCVVGPYASVNCNLTLLSSHVRHDRTPARYPRSSAGDDRFTDYFGASEAIVTSTGNGDSGMFETQLRDERFLPFEGSGVISRWRLELPGEYPQFDYSSISDVVLSIRYTAREGGDTLRDAASDSIAALLDPPQRSTAEPLRFPVVLSCRSEFPTEWARAVSTNSDLMIPVTRDLLPYWMEAARVDTERLDVLRVTFADLPRNPTGPLEFNDADWPRSTNGVVFADLGRVDTAVTSDLIVLLSVGRSVLPS